MSEIVCEKNIESEIIRAVSSCAFSVTDTNVKRLYPHITENSFVITAGEGSKTPETLFSILSAMKKAGVKRGDAIAAVGGGVVGDITGFAAAIYMRGVDWISVPTSLLAMVDSGLGGKTAVDFEGVKNLIGAFHSPKKVMISTHFLKTLPDREWLCGEGELIKTCVLESFAYEKFKRDKDKLFERDDDTVFDAVKTCVEIKSGIVEKDPTENGLRKILNVGHTVGHAIESIDGYALSHGEYVIKGMAVEAAMARDIIEPEFYREYITLLKRLSSPPKTTARAVLSVAVSDKKNVGNSVTLMIPIRAGEIKEVRLSAEEFTEKYTEAVKELK